MLHLTRANAEKPYAGDTVCHVVNSNITTGALPTLQISLVIVALFEKIYNGEPILTVVSNIGEDVHYNTVVKSMSQPDTMRYWHTIIVCK
jgi:hypothetical protein